MLLLYAKRLIHKHLGWNKTPAFWEVAHHPPVPGGTWGRSCLSLNQSISQHVWRGTVLLLPLFHIDRSIAKQDRNKLVSQQADFLVDEGNTKLAIFPSITHMEQRFGQAGKKSVMVFCPLMVKKYYLATCVLEEITVKCNRKCFFCFLLFFKINDSQHLHTDCISY